MLAKKSKGIPQQYNNTIGLIDFVVEPISNVGGVYTTLYESVLSEYTFEKIGSSIGIHFLSHNGEIEEPIEYIVYLNDVVISGSSCLKSFIETLLDIEIVKVKDNEQLVLTRLYRSDTPSIPGSVSIIRSTEDDTKNMTLKVVSFANTSKSANGDYWKIFKIN